MNKIPDSTTRQPGFKKRWKIITLASRVKTIWVLVFIADDHNSAVTFNKYTYLLPVCEVIYKWTKSANRLQLIHIPYQ